MRMKNNKNQLKALERKKT